jgi:uncharacterized membrane protein
VNSSRYSEVYGFPVAGIGVIGYAAMLGVLALEKSTPFFRRNSILLVFGMALTGFLFTAWLVYVEIALLHALCPFCIVSQIAMVIFFVISIARLIREPQN